MARVYNSKEPTAKQMLNMASNLKNRFNKPALIQVNAWHLSSNKREVTYNLYVEDTENGNFHDWPTTLSRYRLLMQGKI